MDNARGFSKMSIFFSHSFRREMIIFGSILVSLSQFSCSNSDHTSASPRNEIIQLLHKQQDDWNSGSVENYMHGYWQSDSTRFVSGANVTYGWQETLERYLKGYSNPARMGRLEFSHLDVQPLATNAALVFGKWQLTRASDAPWGYFTLLLKRTTDGWRIVHDHTSSAQ